MGELARIPAKRDGAPTASERALQAEREAAGASAEMAEELVGLMEEVVASADAVSQRPSLPPGVRTEALKLSTDVMASVTRLRALLGRRTG